MGRLFGTDGVRGKANEALTAELALKLSVGAAHVLAETGLAAGSLGWTYTLLLGLALVYLGEHYVVDLLAGFAVAEAVRRAAPAARPFFGAAAGRIQRLEPGRA